MGKNALQRLDWLFSQHYAKLSERAGRSAARSILSANLTLLLLASTCVCHVEVQQTYFKKREREKKVVEKKKAAIIIRRAAQSDV